MWSAAGRLVPPSERHEEVTRCGSRSGRPRRGSAAILTQTGTPRAARLRARGGARLPQRPPEGRRRSARRVRVAGRRGSPSAGGGRAAVHARTTGAASIVVSDVADCYPSIGETAIRLAARQAGGDPARCSEPSRAIGRPVATGSRSARRRRVRSPRRCSRSPTSEPGSPGACRSAGWTTSCSPGIPGPSIGRGARGRPRSASSVCASTRGSGRLASQRSPEEDRSPASIAVASCAGREVPVPRPTRAHVRSPAFGRVGVGRRQARRARGRRRPARRRPCRRPPGRDDPARVHRCPCAPDEPRALR